MRRIKLGGPAIGIRERRAVDRVLRRKMLAQGPEVAALEDEFSEFLAGQECVAVNSGTSALHLGLVASGLKAGDEVIVPSFSFAATANAVVLAGGTPVFVDVSLDDYCINPDAVRAAITSRTVGIMPVHLFGHPARMKDLRNLASQYGLRLFEDAAQAHLAEHGGQKVGTFGDFAAFSFYPTKNMTSGEGGLLTTPSPELARSVRLLRNQGMEERYRNEIIGYNNRMSDIHAAIGRVQLQKLSVWTKKRVSNAKYLSRSLSGVITPSTLPGSRHVFHQFTIRVESDRQYFVAALSEKWNIDSGIYYPVPLHELPALKRVARVTDLEATKRLCEEVVSLPVHPGLSKSDLNRIIEGTNTLASR